MKLRLILLILLLGGIGLFVVVNGASLSMITSALSNIDGRLASIIGLAVALQIVGHVLRVLRTKRIIDEVRKGGVAGQFRSLAIGYLFNILAPFRFGELVRAFLIAQHLNISFLYTFTAVAIERTVDLLFVSGVAVALIFIVGGQGDVATFILAAASGAIVLSLIILVGLWLLSKENDRVLQLVWRVSQWFNASIRNSFRFKVWSLIYGLQRFVSNREAVRNYVLLTLGSWTCYVLSGALLVVVLLPMLPAVKQMVAALAPYIAASAPSSSSLQAFSETLQPVIDRLHGVPGVSDQYTVLIWLLLGAPMAAIGVVAILLERQLLERRNKRPSTELSYTNKLLRLDDLSQEFPSFLDSYFAGDRLAKIIHKLETNGELSLVKFFKGGSDAITILVLQKNELFVKKIIPLEYEDRLRAQYEWLKRHSDLKYLVKVRGEQKTPDFYAIDLEYNAENIPFFEFLHQQRVDESKAVLESTWKYLYKSIHTKAAAEAYHPKIRDEFIDKHILGCVEKASLVDDELKSLVEQSTIIVNGHSYDNLHQILDRIKKHPIAWRDIATFQLGKEVHGDMAIDNILVSLTTKHSLIIDPAPDGNLVVGPVFDLGKLAQSFYCGYEFLLRDDSPVHVQGGDKINYLEQRTTQYHRLWRFLREELAPDYIGISEQRSLMFHAATLHLRRLKHQVNYNPENVIKFYAVGVKTLNDFLAQYESEASD